MGGGLGDVDVADGKRAASRIRIDPDPLPLIAAGARPVVARRDLSPESEREMIMATLELANTRQLKRIARALEKLAGLEHDEPADWLDVMKPKET